MVMTRKDLSPQGLKMLEENEKRIKAANAKAKAFTKEVKENAKTATAQKQVTDFVKALREGNRKELAAISKDVEQEYKSQNVTTAGDGGYLVPTIMEANIVDRLVKVSQLRQFFTIVNNAPAKYVVNSEVLRPNVAWTAEEAAYNATKATFAPTTINAFKLTGLVGLTEEFEQDALGAAATISMLERQIGEAIGIEENKAFITGDGTTRPNGFRNLTLTGAQTANTTHAGITWDIVKNLKRGLTQANRLGTFFLLNDKIENTLDKLKDTTNRYIYRDEVAESDFDRILSRPSVNADELVADEMWHINGRGYVVTDVAGIRLDWGLATGDFENGRRSMRVMKRVGGAAVLNECFAKLIFTA